MVDVIQAAGYECIGTDIQGGIDFLNCDAPGGIGAIITNPPFCIADKFIERCAKHGLPFALLLKSQYFQAKKRIKLFLDYKPTYILPLTWRVDFMKKKRGGGSPTMDLIWVVWLPCNNNSYPQYIPLKKPKEN